ncbi:propionyl-CoA synthetase [Arthrobacter agilis]|uniref:AMP-binding protein n=1 Tax=Arthrobacter agilis TaxID=37921 RepID=UPI000B355312|nr:AMP-binding protein [Arthrobacter agilis]OUM45358.1 propionyl-CoA synthetase [Arthrobacter agilis]PPB47013.1 propionyl-CoA synthetase [Arthrobacter agilis]TPV23391.1 propionyl-CoA synthetase [Arthrobacter agilis]VDR31768.1 Acetyl-coenzyme A synthetase [Arthrobacter agilis]
MATGPDSADDGSFSPDDYRSLHARSLADPEAFWLEAARAVDWSQQPERALDSAAAPLHRWFPSATLNTSYNALDRHVEAGHGDRTALVYDSAMLGLSRTYTYADLRDEVAVAAGALADLGVGAGDRVLIYLPMIPEAVIAMLATARLGAVHSVVFGGFAPAELAARIRDARPSAVVTASGGLEPGRRVEYLPAVREALALADSALTPVMVKHRDGFDSTGPDGHRAGAHWVDWDEAVGRAVAVPPVEVVATDPLYILYTSGTTGAPKGVVRDNGGHAVALAWSMRSIYGIGPGDVMLTASDVGWVVGHSYIVYGPLLAGATTVLYEGKPVGTPDAGAFGRLIDQHRVNVLFTAPTALRAIRRVDPRGEAIRRHDLSSLRTLFSAGERLDTGTSAWIGDLLGVPVVDNWWQTETGWPICASPRGLGDLPLKAGSPSLPSPGYDVVVLDDGGSPVPAGTEGSIALRLPLPPGALTTLWGSDERYRDSYLSTFEGYYTSGDSGYVDEEGYVFVMGRTDDVINVAGHRLSTGAIEQVIAGHPAVAECAVLGVEDPLKGQRASAYVVLKAGEHPDPAELEADLVRMVRAGIGPVADFRSATVVEALPKTRSGKILRKTMRQIAAGKPYTVPSTIEDASVLDVLKPLLRPAQRG